MSSSQVHRSGERDWTSLPNAMLNRISDKLVDFSDFIRFRSVCPSWRASVPASASPPQLPWLLIPQNPERTGDLQFYSLSTRKIHNVPVAVANRKELLGLANHYFLAVDAKSKKTSLLNPITGNEFPLPILSSKYQDSVCVGTVPIYNKEYVGFFKRFSRLLVVRPLSIFDWKFFPLRFEGQGPTFYKGKYYIYDQESRALNVFDLSVGLIESIKILPPETSNSLSDDETMAYFPMEDFGEFGERIGAYEYHDDYNYLIESSGDLLRVSQRFDGFTVYSVDLGCENPQWVKTNSIGDAMIFLDTANGFALNASDFPGFRGNCIYFMRPTNDWDLYKDFTLCKYHLEDGEIEVLTGSIDQHGAWFIPSLC